MKLLILFICSIGFAAHGQSTSPSSASSDIEQTIKKIERIKDRAYVQGDKNAFERIYADDYVVIDAAGGTSNKRDLIKFNTGLGQVLYETHTSGDITVRAFTDFAIVTGSYTFKYKKAARGDDSGQYRYTTIYALRSGQWQIVADQFTRIKK